MITGIFPVPRATLIARELRCQGIMLETWANEHGMTYEYVEDVLNGYAEDNSHVEAELAITLGVTVNSLTRSTPVRVGSRTRLAHVR
jgi:hypothetical protein